MPTSLQFLPLNTENEADVAIAWQFRTERIAADVDPLAVIPWQSAEDMKQAIINKRHTWPDCAFHIWQDEQIVGQIECDVARFKPGSGYVNFYYLIPELRHQGLGHQLVNFTDTLFRKAGMHCVQLTTSPANASARVFYKKHGYQELGPRPDKPHLILLEKPL